MHQILSTSQLNIGYKNNTVQTNLNLNANKGDLICLVGTNGSGKSTLLRTLSALQKPLSGDIYLNGTDIKLITHTQRSKTIALVLTDSINIEKLTVKELVTFGRYPYTDWTGKLSSQDEEIITKAIHQVNLIHKQDSFINQISDGEKQRAIIAKALAQNTPLVMLDEPTAHLDLPNRIEVMLLLKKLSKETGKTFILSTHELDLAIQISDRIWLFTPDSVHIGIPEDLMVNNIFQQAFGKPSYYFDPNDGHCKVNYTYTQYNISVQGTQPYTSWVEQAFKRNGIAIHPSSPNKVVVSDINNYKYNNKTITKIEHLINEAFLNITSSNHNTI